MLEFIILHCYRGIQGNLDIFSPFLLRRWAIDAGGGKVLCQGIFRAF